MEQLRIAFIDGAMEKLEGLVEVSPCGGARQISLERIATLW